MIVQVLEKQRGGVIRVEFINFVNHQFRFTDLLTRATG